MPSASWLDTLHARSASAEGGPSYPWGSNPDAPVTRGDLPFLNARAFGALGDGATDDSAAIQAAVDEAGEQGGAVFLGPGTFLCDTQIDVPSGVGIFGLHRDATTVKAGADVADGAIFSFEGTSTAPVVGAALADLTLDCDNVTNASALGYYYATRLAFRRLTFANTAFKHVQCYVDTQSTLDNQDLVFEDCQFETAAGSVEAVTIANTERAAFLRCLWDLGSANPDVLLYQLTDRVTFVDCTFDTAPIYSLSTNNTLFERCQLPAGIGGANLSDHGAFGYTYVEGLVTRACLFGGPLNLGSTRGYRDFGSTFAKTPQNAVGLAPTTGNAQGFDSVFSATVFRSCDTSSSAWGLIYLPDSTTDLGVLLDGCTFDDDQAVPTQGAVFNLSNAIAYSGLRAVNCQFTGGAAKSMTVGPGSLGASCLFAGNDGYNPVGDVTVAVPASGTAVAAAAYHRTFYVTNGNASLTVAVQDGPTVTVPASAFATIELPAGKALTPTYTTAPTWTVQGH